MKLTEKVKTLSTRVGLFGLSGSGKSTLAADLSKEFNLYWFSLDNDLDILLKLPHEQQERVEVFDIPDSATFPVAADTLMKLFKTGKGNICDKHGVFECVSCKKQPDAVFNSIDFSALDSKRDVVVIDTGSQLSHSILAHALKGQPIDYKPERDDWGALRKWTEFFSIPSSRLPESIWLSSFMPFEATMEDDKVKLVPSFGSKDMSSKIAGAFSHIVYTDVRNKKHIALSSSTASGTILTKSRTGFNIEDLPIPSLRPIFKGEISPAKIPETTGGTPAHSALAALAKLRVK